MSVSTPLGFKSHRLFEHVSSNCYLIPVNYIFYIIEELFLWFVSWYSTMHVDLLLGASVIFLYSLLRACSRQSMCGGILLSASSRYFCLGSTWLKFLLVKVFAKGFQVLCKSFFSSLRIFVVRYQSSVISVAKLTCLNTRGAITEAKIKFHLFAFYVSQNYLNISTC